MARKRNSERVGARRPEEATTSAPASVTNSADLFSFVTPTDFVDLPSKGRFYPDDHPLADKESVEMRHMTAKEEDILTSESLLRKGLALDRMLQSLLVDKSLNLDEFLVGDKNALIIASRVSGFGPSYEVSQPCPECSETNDTTFDLNTLNIHYAEELPEEITMTEEGTFKFELPVTQVVVEVRLLTAGAEKELAEAAARQKKMKLPPTRSTDLLRSVIVSLNDVTDPVMITKFVDLMPVRDSRHLRKLYETVKPDVNMTHEFSCESCEYAGRVQVPLTAQFFWPDA